MTLSQKTTHRRAALFRRHNDFGTGVVELVDGGLQVCFWVTAVTHTSERESAVALSRDSVEIRAPSKQCGDHVSIAARLIA